MTKEFPKHLSLMKDNDSHFVIHDSRDNKTFPVEKKSLHPAHQIKIMKMKKFSGGGIMNDEVGQTEGDTDTHENWGDSPQGQTELQAMPKSQPQEQAPPPIFQSMPDISGRGAPPPEPAPQAKPQGQDMSMPSPQGYPTLGAFNSQQNQAAQGINQASQGQLEQNSQFAQAQKNYMALEEERNAHYQQAMAKYQMQNESLTNDVANHKIDPDKYWENHSRVAAGISVLLSGMAGGINPTTHNLAMETIQNGINRSIDSQKAELGKKENLLSNNLKVQGNLMQAENATRLQTGAMLQGKLAQIANQTGDPMIIGNAKAKIAEMRMAQMPMQQQLAQYQAQMAMREKLSKMDTSKMDPAQLVNYLPNVTPEAKTQILKEIDAAQNVNKNSRVMADAQGRAADNLHVADFIPGRNNADQDQLHTLLGPTFKDLGESVRQAAMDNVFHGVTPRMGDAALSNKETLRNTLKDYLSSKEAAPTAKSYGLDLSKFESTRFPREVFEANHPMEGKTASDAKGNRIIFKNGAWGSVGR